LNLYQTVGKSSDLIKSRRVSDSSFSVFVFLAIATVILSRAIFSSNHPKVTQKSESDEFIVKGEKRVSGSQVDNLPKLHLDSVFNESLVKLRGAIAKASGII
jgi:hypothetical protein